MPGLGGFIFLCNNEIVEECQEKLVFGMTVGVKEEVLKITPGLPLFLFNISTKEMLGGYVAAGRGGFSLDASAFMSATVARRPKSSASGGRSKVCVASI
jgi:hypothetical protein|tara:strand:- start:62 stop:358 length:297 start_codon:yes stop_codon:yes gene_type:complete